MVYQILKAFEDDSYADKINTIVCAFTGRYSSVGSVSVSQEAVPWLILASGTFFHGKIISLFR